MRRRAGFIGILFGLLGTACVERPDVVRSAPGDGGAAGDDVAACDQVFNGDVVASSSLELEVLRGVKAVDGSLSLLIDDPGERELDLSPLSCLEEVRGDLHLGKEPDYILDPDGQSAALQSLASLQNLVRVDGDLGVASGNGLVSLEGLESLSSIGGALRISANQRLVTLRGLEALTSVGMNLYIVDNVALTDIGSLANLSSVSSLYFYGNSALPNLDGLEGLVSTDVGVHLLSNRSLSSLGGLSGLVSVGSTLGISDLPSLTTLDELRSLTVVGGDLRIEDNARLCQSEAESWGAALDLAGTLIVEANTGACF